MSIDRFSSFTTRMWRHGPTWRGVRLERQDATVVTVEEEAERMLAGRARGDSSPVTNHAKADMVVAMPDRPAIPEAIKRSVRQRCAYGCVICGLPVYEYDHMVDWSVTRRHVAEEITLLCPVHHSEKTRGLRTVDEIVAADADPANRRVGWTAPYGLSFKSTDPATLRIGSNWIRWHESFSAVVVDDVVLFGFRRDGTSLGLRLLLHNEFNEPELVIENSVVLLNSGAWDIQFEGQLLTVRRSLGDIVLRVRFEPPAQVTLERALLAYNGVLIDVRPGSTEFMVGNVKVRTVGSLAEAPIGIKAGYGPRHSSIPSMISAPKIDRYGGAVQIAPPGSDADDESDE